MKKMKVLAVVLATSAAAVLGVACGDDGGGTGGGGATGVCADVDCSAAVPKFSELPWDLCTSCHASDATTRATNGVPDDSDYTTYAGVSSRIMLIAERVNASGVDMMPPSGSTQPTDAERQAFTTWGCCDGPQ